MKRISLLWTLFVVFTVFVVFGCNERLTQPGIVALAPYEAGTSGEPNGIHRVPEPECAGRCCPTASECYPEGNPSAYSGAECLSARDNTGQRRIQLRQTLSHSITPRGVANITDVLARRTELKSAACNAPEGVGGFIQLMEIDRERDVARVGFARHVVDAATALEQGLCFVEDTYDDPDWALDALYTPSSDWPKGLPSPMPLPWKVSIVNGYRYTDEEGRFVDFDVDSEREALLARFDPDTGDLHGKYNGVYYFDEESGYFHGYAPLAFILNYEKATVYNAIPIRETDIKMQLNDPAHPNCAGSLLGDSESLPATCIGGGTNRAWGCPPGNCGPEQLAPVRIEGYFLIAELEQVRNSLLDQTLCKVFPGGPYPGWETQKSCRSDGKWNPKDPVDGLPPGDWCAAVNGPATPQCHDAWKSISYSTFQGFPIRESSCTAH